MSGKLVSIIYFYLISAGAIVLIIIGLFSTVNFVINTTQFDEYPLPYMGEDCSNPYGPYAPKMAAPDLPQPQASVSPDQIAHQQQLCQERIALESKKRKIEDLRNAVMFSLVGVVLFAIHFPAARKQS